MVLSPPQPDLNDNRLPGLEPTVRPTVNERELVQNRNEILLNSGAGKVDENPSNVLMSQATENSVFSRTEVLAGRY